MVNFAGEDAADARHNTPPRDYMYDPAFTMPTSKEPAMPPARDPEAPRPIDEARQERNERADRETQQNIRATALSLAVSRANANEGTSPAEVFVAADQFAAYIKDGTKP